MEILKMQVFWALKNMGSIRPKNAGTVGFSWWDIYIYINTWNLAVLYKSTTFYNYLEPVPESSASALAHNKNWGPIPIKTRVIKAGFQV